MTRLLPGPRPTRLLTARVLTAATAAAALALTALAPTALAATPAPAATAPTTTAAAPSSTSFSWQPRPEQYAATVTTKDLAIPMSDGVRLRADLTLPAGADGQAIGAKVPVVVTITAYNKTVIAGGFGSTLAGADPAYLVKRGYAQLTVDARGTGSSEGQWNAFDAREDRDAAEVMIWAHEQPWSNGSTAMTGASYMGISQIFAAAGRPAGLKAIFPQVPGADVYRDVVASGGQVDSGFMPLWLGLVTGAGLVPPAVAATDPQSAIGALASRIGTATTFTGPVLATALAGGETAYDGPFYAERSPINVVDRVDVPTFLVSGEYDLFQRGTPLLFENLQRRGVPVKMIIGPWDHLKGSSGAEVGQAGFGPLNELQLRWFDHYVRGVADPGLEAGSAGDIAPVTYYEQGTGTWRTTDRWVGEDRVAATWRLSGSTSTTDAPGSLVPSEGATGPVTAGTADVLPVPVAGLCTRSTNQWTAGVMAQLPFPNPCLQDNAPNDRLGVVYETAPLTTAARFQGPINARLYVSSAGGNGMLSVAVEDVAPDGTVARLTGGWQVLSHRALDTGRSRYLDGRLVQPYHPFTKAAEKPLAPGAVEPVDVEVFPTGAVIQPGHRLRLAVQAFDTPHLLPTLPQLLGGALTSMTIHSSAQYPSALTVPAVRTPEATRTTARLARARTGTGTGNTLTVRVTAGRTPTGVVDVLVNGVRRHSATLRGGVATIALPKRAGGTYRVVTRFRGSTWFRPSSAPATTWSVRR